MKRCPKCGKEYDSTPWLCTCGYEFSGTEPDIAPTTDPAPRTVAANLSFTGIVIFAIGGAIAMGMYRSGLSGPGGVWRTLSGVIFLYASSILTFILGLCGIVRGEQPRGMPIIALLLPLSFFVITLFVWL